MSSAMEVLKACFSLLKSSKKLNVSKISEELEMLGFEDASEKQIKIAWLAAQRGNKLSEALHILSETGAKLAVEASVVADKREAVSKKPQNVKKTVTNQPNTKHMPDNAMKEVVEYKTVWADSHWELEKKVNNAINKGWQPLGGMAVHLLIGKTAQYVQTIVKYG